MPSLRILIFRSLIFYSQLLLLLLLVILVSATDQDGKCPSSFKCGHLGDIKFPFTDTQHPHCGVLAIHGCDDPKANKSIQLKNTPSERFIAVPRFQPPNIIVVKDESQLKYLKNTSCKSFSNNFTFPASPLGSIYVNNNYTFFRCNKSLSVTLPQHFNKYTNCSDYNIYYYAPPDTGIPLNFQLPRSLTACPPVLLPVKNEPDGNDPFSFLSFEIQLEVQVSDECGKCIHNQRGQCQLNTKGNFSCVRGDQSWVVKMGLGLGLGLVTLVLTMVTLWFTKWKNKSPSHPLVDAFLEKHGRLQIQRYNYSEMKKVTNSFKHKLGQGGFGSVYKGQLHDGRHVAVKILSESKGDDGQDFINEVASMSRTSHVNIVALLGFCFEGSKRALVYEFMPNGSLEKLIYEENAEPKDCHMDCQTLYDIAIGVARGLEYLHKGCNTRILHFDIKPHNILLDENFCPKISDFGLAKVCTGKESMVSIFGTRGTAGYIAPEVFSRNFGTVSHKSDVYSYGMMVLEMVGRRKNIKVEADVSIESSEIYFPHWIYNRLVSNQELGLRGVRNESDDEAVRKMTMVSLWCIQTNPSSRPSISRVVEMLEGRIELLQLPRKPFWFSPSTSPHHLSL